MNPFVFLIDILFHLYTVVLMLRLLLQWAKADFYNPVSQFIVKITNPLVLPLRKIIPGFFGLDFATLVLILVISTIKILIVYSLSGYNLSSSLLIITVLLETIDLLLNIFLFAIIIQALLSWVNPDPYNPVVALLNSLTWPILKHFRKLIPPISGFDISPIFAIISIMFIQQSIHYLVKAFI
ncbi:MAG: YggT family protein [Gammaproteobacteria bacterium]|nr:YggT family protein [Gammaproteobacteria bacterium]